MDITNAYKNFDTKLKDLENTINDFNKIIISETSFGFVYDNANFLTKSFLINLCGYLETYLKDVLELLLLDFNERIRAENLPYNLIRWNIEQKPNSNAKMVSLLEKKHCRFESFEFKIKKKDLDNFISGNPFRTKEIFEMFGINLEANSEFNNYKDLINTIVTKRNNILHHNDEASDLANSDIIMYLKEIKKYIIAIDREIASKIVNHKLHLIKIRL